MDGLPKNSIPLTLQNLLADLDFLSQIERNMKPCCNDRVLVDADSWSGAFYRFFKGESRMNVISKVEQIVNNTVEAIENQKYNEHLGLTINALYKASNGILNLSYTYESDPNMKARINVQLKNINIQLDRYRTLIKGFRPEDQPVSQVSQPQVSQVSQVSQQIFQSQSQPLTQQNSQQIPQSQQNSQSQPLPQQIPQNNESPHSSSSISSPSSVIDLLDSTTSVDFERKKFKRPIRFKKSADKEL